MGSAHALRRPARTAAPAAAPATEVGMTLADVDDLYRLLAIAKYDDRYVIPQAHAETAGDLYAMQGSCGFDVTPAQGVGISAGEPPVDLRRMLEERQ